MSKPLRRIGDPVVAAAPAGVRIRTRIHPSAEEAAALTAIGQFLGSVYRSELAERIRLGRLDHKAHAAWRAERKQALTAVSSSRWAGTITRAVEDHQYQLGMRGLAAGYRSASERFARTRRLAVLRDRLATTEEALVGGRPAGRRSQWEGNVCGATATSWIPPI